MAEKKQIVFAVSVVLIGIAGIYSFTSDLVRSFKNNKPSIIDKSEIEEQKEMFGMAKEEIKKTKLPDFDKIKDENAFENILTNSDTMGKVVNVFDGATISVDIDDIEDDDIKGTKIRLIGVDVPNTLLIADENGEEKEVSVESLVKEKVKVGDAVYIEYDEETEDKNGNTLAYLYLSDGTMLEEWLISNGYAYAVEEPPNVKYTDRFLELSN